MSDWLNEHMNSIVLGDSYELIKYIPDNSIDLIYTDPPYEFHSGMGEGGIFKNRIAGKYEDIKGTILTEGIDLNILDEFVRVMKHINIFLWCNKEQILDYLRYFTSLEGREVLFEILTWHKTNPTPMTKNTFLPDTEYCLYFREKGKVKLNDGYELKSKYYLSATNKSDKDKYGHPTIKPFGIVEKHILHTTKSGGVVLDPFSGSGTTSEVCKSTGRNFVGIEIDPNYHKISVDRLNGIDKNGQMSIFAEFED